MVHSWKSCRVLKVWFTYSEITWANTPINAKEFFKLGDEHEAKIVTLDKASRKMSLSIKQLSTDPWNDIETKFAEGSRHTGLVKNITNLWCVC